MHLRNNEFYGEFSLWDKSDNHEQLSRLQRNLHCARREVLTKRQQEILSLYYDERMRVSDIAEKLHISKSTVSRSLSRSREKLREHLKYSF